jgi:hypothetical protein
MAAATLTGCKPRGKKVVWRKKRAIEHPEALASVGHSSRWGKNPPCFCSYAAFFANFCQRFESGVTDPDFVESVGLQVSVFAASGTYRCCHRCAFAFLLGYALLLLSAIAAIVETSTQIEKKSWMSKLWGFQFLEASSSRLVFSLLSWPGVRKSANALKGANVANAADSANPEKI